MKSIQVFIFFTFLVFIYPSLYAQFKVKDSSERKQPGWVQNKETGDIVSKGTGLTLDEAKSKAIDAAGKSIKEKVIQQMLNENTYFKSLNLDKNAASGIFVSSGYYANLKAGNSDGMYWELLLDKKTKKESYNYYLKYALQQEKLASIVRKIADERISALLDTLQKQLTSFKTIDTLKKIWGELMFLNPIFSDTDKNKVKCEELLNQVEDIFSRIEIAGMMNTPGKLIVTLLLENKVLESSIPPTLKSDCAKLLNTNNSREKWTIDYAYDKCPSSPFNIAPEFNTGFDTLSKDFTVNPKDERIEVKMSNTDIIIKANNITFYVSSLYRKKLILDRIIIRYNDLNVTDTPMHQVLEGAGLYNITFNLPPGFDKVNINDRVRGELYYHSQKSGQNGIYTFYNHRIKRN